MAGPNQNSGVTVTWTDKGLREFREKLKALEGLSVAVGYQGPSGADTAAIATYLEFGTKTIPSRPFMRRALDNSGPELQDSLDYSTLELMDSPSFSAEDFAEDLALTLQDVVYDTIETAGSWAKPNAESTVRQKGSNLPPLDGEASGNRLQEDLSWVVKSGSSIVRKG
jgi:hypothetical protein